MSLRRVGALLLLILPVFVVAAPAAQAGCTGQISILNASQTCEYSYAELEAQRSQEPTATWSVRPICKDPDVTPEGACFNPSLCTTAAGVPGSRYTIYRDGESVGIACLSAAEETEVGGPPPIRVLVLRAFQNLDWQPSELVVQPPGGKTLVNLDTNFYTSNTDVSSIPVTLVQSTVVVSAEPIAYRWHFGDGTTTTTTSPGAPYPDLDVAHVYGSTGKVVVSVDTQYGAASFTVDGGPPEQIPSTIWVVGEGQDLEVVEALSTLR